ncbi:MAG: carboxypeptidase-like regulatory domain-containing protein, partial [Bacteroidaceae bacterium]
MKCKHINIVFLFLLISMDLVAQIKGTITDSLTREPLSFVSVYYQGKGVGSISKNDGQFVIETR